MRKNKVLVITYYWPPSGGSGVQRWLKFVKYLPQFGWHPYVFTPLNPSFNVKDESLEKDVPEEAEVIRFPIWEPYDMFYKLSGVFGKKKSIETSDLVKQNTKSNFEKISTWIRGNIFIPDPRVFWVKPSSEFLEKYLKDNGIKTIITTGPPHSMHLIGYRLKIKDPSLRWIADFRDPWSEWGLLDSLKVSKVIRKRHKQLETKILSTADIVTTITPFYKKHFERLGNRKVELITNGFDEDDFKNIQFTKPEKFTIRHIGIINEKCNPKPFMNVVDQLIAVDKDFEKNVKIEFIGEVNSDFKDFVSTVPSLKNCTQFTANTPHKQLISYYGSSSLLLLILTGYKDAEGYMPGKLFEYLATGLPILAVGPVTGDAALLLNETSVGKMIDSEDKEGVKYFLLDAFRKWKDNSDVQPHKNENLSYSRKYATEKLAHLLNN